MEYFNHNSKTIYLFNVEEELSSLRWAIILNNGIVESAQVVASLSKELGSSFDINHLDEENLSKKELERARDVPSEVTEKIVLLKRILAGRNRFTPEDPLARLLMGGGLNFRNEMIKAHLGVDSSADASAREGLSRFEDENLACTIVLNYVNNIVEVIFDKEDKEEDSNEEKKGFSIKAPKNKFKG